MTTQPYLWRSDGGDTVDRRSALRQLRRDPQLAAVIDRIGPFGLLPARERTPFDYLLRAIVYQQLSGKAAGTILGRVRQIYSPGRLTPAKVLHTEPGTLRGAGLSNGKTAAVLDLASHAARRRLPGPARLRRLSPEQIVARLTQVRGVGLWTAQMLLIFYLGHPDILPVKDLAIRKGFARVCGRRSPPGEAAIERHGARWRPYRSIASWYLWRASELPPDRSPPGSR
jgi:3-methyladenine DNA glycosylase/8-oxoguanine DNA glycosylase